MLHSEISGHVLGEGCGWWGGVRVGTAARLHNEDNLTLKLCYTQGFWYTCWERGAGWGGGAGGLALQLCFTMRTTWHWNCATLKACGTRTGRGARGL